MSNQEEQHKKLRIGILFGGKSAEHEVSIRSAQNVLKALDKGMFEPVLIGIDRTGQWHLNEEPALLNSSTRQQELRGASSLTLLPGSQDRHLINTSRKVAGTLDVVFPVLHGPMGEDGTIQGFLELANVPYVGPGVLSSAIGMDKDIAKRLLQGAGIAVADFIVLHARERRQLDTAAIFRQLGTPVFVKPANMGSSVGVSRVSDEIELLRALDEAFTFDRKVVLETAIIGDEIECAVLGNDAPRTSLPGRIIPRADFYTYEAKYIDEHGATLEIPAQLPVGLTKKIQETALRTFQTLECEGMARVDMFVTSSGDVIVNEVNTIPGFTNISMYPKLWEASGLQYTDLITELIHLAIERYKARQELRASYRNSKDT